jgi:hypothetical protein
MKALRTTAIVTRERRLVVDVPADVPSGRYRVVVVMEDVPAAGAAAAGDWSELVIPSSRWPDGLSLSREDLYGDAGC